MHIPAFLSIISTTQAFSLHLLQSVSIKSSGGRNINDYCSCAGRRMKRDSMSSTSSLSSSRQEFCPRTSNPLPTARYPLPPPLLSITPGTWAHDTMSRRVDSEILQRTFEENLSDFESSRFSDFRVRFEALRTELRDAGNIPLTYLEPLSRLDKEDDDDNNDIDHDRIEEHAEWQAILRPYVSNGETWLSAPWCITEFLVYRKLMECLDYFEPSSSTYRYDPFRNQKEAALVSSVEAAEGALGRIAVLPTNDMDTLGAAVALSLWGNRMDLSLWPVDTTDKLPPSKSLSSLPASTAFAGVLEDASSNLLHDDTSLLTERCNILRGMNGGTGGDVDIIVDNAVSSYQSLYVSSFRLCLHNRCFALYKTYCLDYYTLLT